MGNPGISLQFNTKLPESFTNFSSYGHTFSAGLRAKPAQGNPKAHPRPSGAEDQGAGLRVMRTQGNPRAPTALSSIRMPARRIRCVALQFNHHL